jgi:hypothetical protein
MVQDQSARAVGLGALPAGTFTAAAAFLTVGPLAAVGWFPAALGAGVGYLVAGDLTPRRPDRPAFLTVGAILFGACAVLAQAHGDLDWALGFVAAAVILAYGAAVLVMGEEPVSYEGTDSPAGKTAGG